MSAVQTEDCSTPRNTRCVKLSGAQGAHSGSCRLHEGRTQPVGIMTQEPQEGGMSWDLSKRWDWVLLVQQIQQSVVQETASTGLPMRASAGAALVLVLPRVDAAVVSACARPAVLHPSRLPACVNGIQPWPSTRLQLG